jgi:hypothetical protein
MKRSTLALSAALLVAPACCFAAGEQLIPAGSLIQCTVSEPKLSSKTTAIGDPVLCQMGHAERYGRSVLPVNSYLVGRFEDYKDPGHFVGKGWMELRFDRMVIEPNTIIPVDAKVVAVPGYNVDRDGRILGKGHATRDIVMWSIPILWPVDLLMLPARGPRPTLKEETRLTLKVMDDLSIPPTEEPQRDPYGLIQRQPTAEAAPPPEPYADQPPPQEQAQDAPPMEAPAPEPYPAPAPVYAYAPPPPPAYAYAAPPPVAYGYGYGGGAVIGIYGGGFARGYAAAPRAYGYGGPARGYGYGNAPRPGPRPYGYGAAPRGYGYGSAAAPRAYSYGGAGRGYAAAPRMAGGYGYGGSARGGVARAGR